MKKKVIKSVLIIMQVALICALFFYARSVADGNDRSGGANIHTYSR